MSSSANQPVWVGRSEATELRPHPHEAETGGTEQVLDRAARDRVRAERPRRRARPHRTPDSCRQTRAPAPCAAAAIAGDVVAVPGAVPDRRATDKRRPLVDHLRKPVGADRPVRPGLDVHDLGTAQLLRVRDLPDSRELVLADHDPVPLPRRAAARRRARSRPARPTSSPRRRRPGHGAAPRRPCGTPRSARPRSPTRPRSRPQPLSHPSTAAPHTVRKGPLRARVEIGRALEDPETRPGPRHRASLRRRPRACSSSLLLLQVGRSGDAEEPRHAGAGVPKRVGNVRAVVGAVTRLEHDRVGGSTVSSTRPSITCTNSSPSCRVESAIPPPSS